MAADGSIIMHIHTHRHTHRHKLSYMKNTNSAFHPSYRLFVNGCSITIWLVRQKNRGWEVIIVYFSGAGVSTELDVPHR